MYISELAKKAGVSLKTIRHYENIGLLKTPERIGTYRTYREEDVETVRFIKRVQALGFKLKEIKKLFNAETHDIDWAKAITFISEKRRNVSLHVAELNQLIDKLTSISYEIEACLGELDHSTEMACGEKVTRKEEYLPEVKWFSQRATLS